MKRNSSPSSPRSAPALRLAPVASPTALRLALASHAAGLLALGLLPWPGSWQVALAAALLLSCWFATRPLRWRELVCRADGQWLLVGRDGRTVPASLLPGGLCHPWLVILRWRADDGRRVRLALFHDALPAAEHAALRRALRATAG
ncbi:MAG TPA: protein YgfX [Gammaproteobacteria bacterium]